MKLVTIESPLAGDFERNLRYARWCLRDSLLRGEAPFASHLLYPQCFNDATPEERSIGLFAGQAFIQRVDLVVLYVDFGISAGMHAAEDTAQLFGIPTEIRTLPTSLLDSVIRGESPGATKGAV